MAEVASLESAVGAAGVILLSRFRCDGCGYGASCRTVPERCPMCGGYEWRDEKNTVLTDDLDTPLRRESSY
jgi:rubrerythrin